MSAARTWCTLFVVAAACTCGARTECNGPAQISFLTGVHDDLSCAKLSNKGVVLYEAAGLLAEAHNNRSDDFEIGKYVHVCVHQVSKDTIQEITVSDTCGSIAGALKAALKALVRADINCLYPPHYLGIIGPDNTTNAEAVHKVTSILKVPHIVKKPSISPYLHPLAEESNSYVVQAILKVIEILRWRSFTLVANVEDENDGDDVQNIARKLTTSAIARDLCVIVHDNDEEDYTSHIVHIGKPEEKFFRGSANATVLVVGEGNLRDCLSRVNISNNVLLLLLENSRNIIDALERRIESSHRWAYKNDRGMFHAEELREVRWLEDAVGIYTKALRSLCKNKRCDSHINLRDWNHVVSSVLMAHNVESQAAPRVLNLSLRKKTGDLERLAAVIVRKDKARVYWGAQGQVSQEEDPKQFAENDGTTTADNYEDMPLAFRRLLNREDEPRLGCASAVEETRMMHEYNETMQIFASETNDNEWWMMVCTVSGVGVAMFLMGVFAVYVIYTNTQSSRCPKGKDQLDRDTSLRSISSDREMSVTTRHQRAMRLPQRTSSNRSNVSEKSV